jgi:hypothetical protein
METWETHEFPKGMLEPKPDPYFYDRRLFREQLEVLVAPPPVVTAKAAKRAEKK